MTREKFAFRMKLNPGMKTEYKKRHDEIWPELVQLLRDAGISDCSIHLDEESHILFGVLWRNVDHKMDELPKSPVMQRLSCCRFHGRLLKKLPLSFQIQ